MARDRRVRYYAQVLLPHAPHGVASLRRPSPAQPLRVLVSGCLTGLRCGADGSDYGLATALGDLLSLPAVKATAVCPEDHGMGTPRAVPDIHGGDGFDVLDGRARVFDEHGVDVTEKMIAGAQHVLAHAQAHDVELAVLTDMSAACASQVISDGSRLVARRRYRSGVGVATALLVRNGIAVVSQRDHRTLGQVRRLIDPAFRPDASALDHHETPWYRTYFRSGR